MSHKVVAEFLGTAFLLAIVVGSGIMGETLAQGNQAVALLANSMATGAGLFVLIQCLGSVSGAHLNPVVSFTEFLWRRISKEIFIKYALAQILGAIAGVLIIHLIFDKSLFQTSTQDRNQSHLWISEIVATFGLICTIGLAGRKHVELAPVSIAAYITSAYWFTSSTSFANPAVTIARAFTNTFCGIAPSGIGPFVFAQVLGALAAFYTLKGIIAHQIELKQQK